VAIARATERADFRPSPSRLCEWCDHRSRCPAFGGTPPPFPEDVFTRIEGQRREPPEPTVEPEL
jgi:putative RecB family exonuclease